MTYLKRDTMLQFSKEASENNRECSSFVDDIFKEGGLNTEGQTYQDVCSLRNMLMSQSAELEVRNETRSDIRKKVSQALTLCIRMKGISDKAVFRLNPNAHTPIVFTTAEDCLRSIHAILTHQELKLLHILENTGDLK